MQKSDPAEQNEEEKTTDIFTYPSLGCIGSLPKILTKENQNHLQEHPFSRRNLLKAKQNSTLAASDDKLSPSLQDNNPSPSEKQQVTV